ncbi:hypothetical protein SCLCIDRAFT_33151 [Scleroderma citrinum Foug A]|uniref:Phosphoenolpyruvate carboxykinase (ATP) n=1 Tax=Scleroderma citrinum Foug A TaxID=1036808 RepID=A0A0C2ZG12_9AGAM|nr:hypothetical protein SCLCIDRAFT_33151 [Scleroderma citrinum Foug A]
MLGCFDFCLPSPSAPAVCDSALPTGKFSIFDTFAGIFKLFPMLGTCLFPLNPSKPFSKLSGPSVLFTEINHERAIDTSIPRITFISLTGESLLHHPPFVTYVCSQWDPKYCIKFQVIYAHTYHALFVNNMLIHPTKEALENFGELDFIIYNAGQFSTMSIKLPSQVSQSFNKPLHSMTVTEGVKHSGDLPMLKWSISKTSLTEDHDITPSANDNQANESASSSTNSSTGHRKLKR